MTDLPTAAEKTLRSVVLLENAPHNIGAVLDVLMPGMSAQLGDAPLDTISINLNGTPASFELVKEPLVAPELDYAVSQSPLRDLVGAAVAKHRAYLVISLQNPDVFDASGMLANVTARYADDDAGLAVWLPDADRATTAIMYAGEVDERPASAYFNTMAARLDESTAIAHTIGVHHLGGAEVQLRSSAFDPATAFTELRNAVATVLEARTLPVAGLTLTIAGLPHTLVPAPSAIGMGDVLDAMPSVAQTHEASSAEKPARKGWFRRS